MNTTDRSATAPPTTAPQRMYRCMGTTDDITTCEQCGRSDLKSTVIMAILDADGNPDGESYLGSACAARATGWTQKAIRQAAKDADRERRKAERRARQVIDHRQAGACEAWMLHHHGGVCPHVIAYDLGRKGLELIREFEADYGALQPTGDTQPTPEDDRAREALSPRVAEALDIYTTEAGILLHPTYDHVNGYSEYALRASAERHREAIESAGRSLTLAGWTVTDHGPWITAAP